MRPEREILIQSLIKEGYLKTPLIIEAFKKIDRADFVPEENKEHAYLNTALPIGCGQTISQPLTVAFMLELLQPKPGEKILDIGTGSGWKAALLAYCASKQISNSQFLISKHEGSVISIERILKLKEMAEKNIAKYNFLAKGIVKVFLGDGSRGAPKELAPIEGFDKIIAGAAGEEIPQMWKKQVKIGGRIVAPVKNSIWTFDKISANKFDSKEYYGFSFVPLISE